jgi:hypothetical protein
MILSRIKFHNTIVGCCGSTRNDLIYPVGDSLDFEQFKKDAINTLYYYGKSEQKIYKHDVYYLEYYETLEPQDWRGKELPLLEFFRNENGIWFFRQKGVTQFSVRTIEKLNEKWK